MSTIAQCVVARLQPVLRKLPKVRYLLPVFVLVGMMTGIVRGAPGDLDRTFSSDGYVTTDMAGWSLQNKEVALDTGGRIVAAGAALGRVALLRYTPDGVLDTTFSGDGILLDDLDLEGPGVLPPQLAIDANGKLVIATNAQADYLGFNKMLLARFNVDGSRDPSFGVNGVVVTPVADYPLAIFIDAAGRIILSGESFSSVEDGFLARYLPDGSPDLTFGANGRVDTVALLSRGLSLTTDGAIRLVGKKYLSEKYDDTDLVLAQYTSTGLLDTSFGTNGITQLDVKGTYDEPVAMIETDDGKLLVATSLWDYYNNYQPWLPDFVLLRFHADGTLDTTYGTAGKVFTDFHRRADDPGDVVLLPDGRLIVVGSSGGRAALARYLADGTLDTTFGINGLRIDGLRNDFGGLTAAVLDNAGRLIAVGPAGDDFQVTRYLLDGAPGQELLTNGGFETAGATPKDAAGWSGEKLVKDVRACNKGKQNKFIAFYDKCAFRFKGTTEYTRLIQIIDSPALNIGDTLTVSAWTSYRGKKGFLNSRVWVRVVYQDDTTDKLVTDFSPEYDYYVQAVSLPYTVLAPVKQIEVELIHHSDAGKLYVDNVSLLRTTGNPPTVLPAPVLPLP